MKIRIITAVLLAAAVSYAANANDENLCNDAYDAKNYADAHKHCSVQCDKKISAGCVISGKMYQSGLGVKEDIKQAKELFEKACGMNDKNGCLLLGDIFKKEKNLENVKKYYTNPIFA